MHHYTQKAKGAPGVSPITPPGARVTERFRQQLGDLRSGYGSKESVWVFPSMMIFGEQILLQEGEM